MQVVKYVVDALQTYQIASLEEAELIMGDARFQYDHASLQATIGFGHSGFKHQEGLILTLPGQYTLLRKTGVRENLLGGMQIDGFAQSYSNFFDETTRVLFLKNVVISSARKSVSANIALDFDQATHCLFMAHQIGDPQGPYIVPERRVPYAIKRAMQFYISRSRPHRTVQYVILPVMFQKWYMNTEAQYDHRRYLYIASLLEQYQLVSGHSLNAQNPKAAKLPKQEPPTANRLHDEDSAFRKFVQEFSEGL